MSEKINVNVADAETLATISGIGPALAQRIIEYRETVHPFEEVIELAAVPGISEKMVRGFEASVTVGAEPPGEPVDLAEAEEPPMLEPPEQPVGLLTAVLPDAPVPDETPTSETEEPMTETAVTQPNSPEIEEMPLADSQTIFADPDLGTAVRFHPPQLPADWEAKAQRRGCISTLLGATFGAILGAVLTLAILAALNDGSLGFAASDTEIRTQLDTEIISRTNELNQLSTRVSLVATQEAEANQTMQTDFAAANEAINEELANNEEIISYLATRSGDLELRLEEVAGAADTFTGFLDGLRLLLADLEGGTAAATPTPASAEATVSPTPTPFNTIAAPATVQPTRTPQPTATPFTFPTNTPAPQP